MKPKITALALTFNEEENVKRYVESLSFADEIVFIDSFSSDKTVEIARECGVTVFQREFDTLANQKDFAISKASNDWITFFDLDEVVTPELSKEILEKAGNTNIQIAYSVKRKFFFFGKQIKYGEWHSDDTVKLFNKTTYSLNNELTANGRIKKLKSAADYYGYQSFDSYNAKLNRLSNLEATALYSKNKRPNFYHFFILPNLYFLKKYIVKLGLLEGKEGFILCYLHSFAIFKRYLNLWLMYRKIE